MLSKGLPTALLEVALIFVGITLAIGFENWNSERKERRDELVLLAELKSNLEENLYILRDMIAFNEDTVVSYNALLLHFDERRPYSDDLAPHFAKLDHWSSPYLTRPLCVRRRVFVERPFLTLSASSDSNQHT